MKNLILKNQGNHPADNREELDELMEEGLFSENREIWYWFSSSWHPQNREETLRRFSELESGDNIVCQTVFDGYLQLEIIAIILMNKNVSKGLNFYILHPNLKGEIQDYFNKLYSEMEPNTPEYEDRLPRMQFKKEMNLIVKACLTKHNILTNKYGDEFFKISTDDFIK